MKIRDINFYSLIKLTFKLGILFLFIGGFYKLFLTIPSNLFLKILFSMTYIWFTLGINVNLIMPLISLIDKKIKK